MTNPQDPFAVPSQPDPSTPPPPSNDIPVYGTPPAYGAPPPPPYGAPVGYGQQGPGFPPQQRRNGMGTAALVLGIVGIFPLLLIFVGSVLAVIFGFVGRARVKRGEASNRGAATAGLVLGIIGLVLAGSFWAFAIHEVNTPAGKQWRSCVDAAQASGDTTAESECNTRFADSIFGR